MGRIKKVATERHTATASPYISNFVKEAATVSLWQLRAKLDNFPKHWPFPRGDLYHWIPLLDRFDRVLEVFNKEYGLAKGPQSEPFGSRMLTGRATEKQPDAVSYLKPEDLKEHGFSEEGDADVVESILDFTRLLLEHCGNRSLYASSSHLDALLNTTSLDLLRLCLKLTLRLAQRYQVARYKNSHPNAQALLMQSHYNINLDRLQKIAQPFPRPPQPAAVVQQTPAKSKDKGTQSSVYTATDLVAIAKEPKVTAAKADLASVHFTYYEQSTPTSRPGSAHRATEASPATPTPARRPSALGPSRDRPSAGERSNSSGDVSTTPAKPKDGETPPSSAPQTFTITASRVAEVPDWGLVASSTVPSDYSYDLLHRIRIAKAFTTPETSAQLLVEVRLLAIANLAYALSESKFQERIGQADNEEPKRYHLAQQLCDLLQPPSSNQATLSLQTETAVLYAMEALAKVRHKVSEISDCLQIGQNHGVVYYELRKVMATLNQEEHEDKNREAQESEWRNATFELINTLLTSNAPARAGERMVSAGIMAILVEALNLRTSRAERFYEKILGFFDSFIHSMPSAFPTLANLKGFDIIADLTSYEVTKALQTAKEDGGLPELFKSKVVDYNIHYYQQSTLRQLFKFIAHLFDHNLGTHDRILRNFIDTPQILGALRNVIENASIFGSNVWSGAINILTAFIHNEPTSFQVVSEAGLVKSLLQTVVPWELKDGDESDYAAEDIPVELEYKDGELQYPTPRGILPVGETMCDIPQAFGAICLNENGMKQFQSSNALLKYMDIFVSPPHVRALEEEGQTATVIGQAFDELSRHHPQLKEQIMKTVIIMVKRVSEVCRYLAKEKGVGGKLWERAPNKTPSGIAVAGSWADLAGDDSHLSPQTISPEITGETEKDRANGVPFISVCFKFLEGFFHNTGMCAYFCEQGGAIYLLDLATSPSNPHDLVAFPSFLKIAGVVKTMCETKPHLVLPSLLSKTQAAVANLKPLVQNKDPRGAFASLVDMSEPQASSLFDEISATTVLKALSSLHILTHMLGRVFAPPPHTSPRHNNGPSQLFTNLNFTDVYLDIVNKLSQIHAACIWEHLILQKNFSDEQKQQTDPRPFMMRRPDASGLVEYAAEIRLEGGASASGLNDTESPKDAEQQANTFGVRNAKALRYLLSQAPMGVESFFHSLGQALFPRRSSDTNVKQHALLVAEHIAQALSSEIEFKKFGPVDQLTDSKYVNQMATACSRILLRAPHQMESWNSKEALTIVLNKFYVAKGFDALNGALLRFSELLMEKPATESERKDVSAREDEGARTVINSILSFYGQVVKSKCITEALQSSVLKVSDHKAADYFSPGQLVVEIRDAVLPAVDKLWHSDARKLGGEAKPVIDILRSILKADGEERAVRRSENASRRVRAKAPEFKLRNTDGLRHLKSNGYDERLAREALYRCNNHESHASEYCNLRNLVHNAPSFPIPSGEPVTPRGEQPADAQVTNGESSDPQNASGAADASVEMPDAPGAPEQASQSEDNDASQADTEPPSEDYNAMSDDDDPDAQGTLPLHLQEEDLRAMAAAGRSAELHRIANGFSATLAANSLTSIPTEDTHQLYTTIEDLDEKRTELRDDLIDRCLEVLSAQPSMSFDLAELIQAAVAKSGESANPRADIGRTLVSSLLSLQGEEPSPEGGAKISAYAHLVALILKDSDFFHSTLDELKEYFGALISWIQLGQDQKAEDAPWIQMILLIMELVLSEDEQPARATWTEPSAEDASKPLAELELPEPIVSPEDRKTLFDALIDLLPKIGKNATLALSVSRVLVLLTRKREMAMRLSEKNNMSRLFLMIRQLSGSVDDKLHGAFMIILRHMVEDEAIIRQIMQTEIRKAFELQRASRPFDSTTYVRTLYHLVLRDPQLFAKVTEETVEIANYESNPSGRTIAQTLRLKRKLPPLAVESEPHSEQASEQQPAEAEADAKKSIEDSNTDTAKATEPKPPTVEVTDGVVQFLLRELSTYRDVEDKPATPPKEPSTATTNGTNGDVEMTDAAASASATPTPSPAPAPVTTPSGGTTKSEKPIFKPEEHPIYMYRCFILQCLAELLASYNRTKVEFMQFSRKADANPNTPLKPHASTLNYLLTTLLPVGTLEHPEDIPYRKKLATSHWAMTVIVALCTATPERHTAREETYMTEENSELMYVRRFVLEHGLKAFREATMSSEKPDVRYSRLLVLAELFNRILHSSRHEKASSFSSNSQALLIGKLMYEKNFIHALTSAIAEIDLNFPNAKRAVKYILGPLRTLSELGVWMSQRGDFPSNAADTAEEDDISSATSLSDEDDEREQTPDLYRNSTLGMFEPTTTHEEDEESDSEEDEDDEDMYDDEYDEEMDYEGEPMPDHGEVVSDDDEEIEGAEGIGPIEGVPGDVAMDVDIVVDEEDMDGMGSYDEDDDDEDDEEDDDEDDGEETFAEGIDEITGDDENASMGDADGVEGWEDDDEDGDPEIIDDAGSPHGGPLDQLARVVAGGEDFRLGGPDDVVQIDVDHDDHGDYFEDEMAPEEDDGLSNGISGDRHVADFLADEEDEMEYENEVVYEPDIDGGWISRLNELRRLIEGFDDPAEDDDEYPVPRWDWEAPPPPAVIRGHHHHHRNMMADMFEVVSGDGLRGDYSITQSLTQPLTRAGPGFRTHRTTNARGDEDWTNPLLHRDNSSGNNRDRSYADVGMRGWSRRTPLLRQGDAIIQDLMNSIGGGGNHAINVNIEPRWAGQAPPMFAIAGRHGDTVIDIGSGRPWRDHIGSALGLPRMSDLINMQRGLDSRTPNTDEAHAVEFRPVPTTSRWQDEARILFGNTYHEKAMRVLNTLLRLLVPPAIEAKKKRDEEEAKRREEEARLLEEERKRVEAEKAEREAKEAKEKEEQEAREAEEARAREEAERERAAAEGAGGEDASMEGVEPSQPPESSEVPTEAGQAAEPAAERITTTIRGREIDITNLGIDLGFLEELPEEIREEVIMNQFAEQRSQQTQAGEQLTEIDRDFMDALPPDIQRELMRQEAAERRRREREEARRRTLEEGGGQPAQPEDMNNADFFATLDPVTRQEVLRDLEESNVAALPEEIQAEHRTYARRIPRPEVISHIGRFGDPDNQAYVSRAELARREAERARRPIVQMLDKSGVATLLRLMFVSLHHKAKSNLNGILSDVCKNANNRAEVISILLTILQDGTADVNAVERSFANLSLRAKQGAAPKTPQPVKRTATGTVVVPGAELSPLNIVQQCLATLSALSENSRVPSFFLTEHETIISQKIKSGKKGKGQESKAAKYPLNALLTLLDRKLITENPGVMETLASLLSRVTRPLQNLYRRAQEEATAEQSTNDEPNNTAEAAGQSMADVQMGEASASGSAAANSAAEATNEGQQEPADGKDQSNATKTDEKKKHRELVPPEVPEENLRLVVNIFTARECPSKTMSETLDVIKYLSYLPGAREIFGKELVRQAQLLSEAVLVDLEELAKQIESADSGNNLQSVALANFSSATSKQQKLLRAVTALDHLFDPEQMPTITNGPDATEQPKLKEDILAALYESPTFDKLWESLSQCLTAIRNKGNMINVAAILLPLIESLMVVCRNSALKDTPLDSVSPVVVSTPPPVARLESLFFRFTEEHRKILNELIRTNPKLMNGKFAVLAKNSKVLEFDNKRAYFNRKVHTRPTNGNHRPPHSSLQLSVRRDQVFLDSFKSLYYKTGDEVKYGKLNIRFHGEEGIDAGGVSREWFAAMARQMFNPDYALFNPVASDRTTFHPNSLSEVNPDHLTFFKFIGRIIGKSLYEGRVLDCHFSRAVYRRILGKSVSLKDMESLDLDYYKSLVWILENDITDITFETFSVDVDRFGLVETVDLVPNGHNIAVTEENKQEYVRLVVEHRLVKSVEKQLEHFLAGFHEIIPAELIAIFNEQELELLISGLPDIDIDDWKNNTEYHNYQPTSPQIQWFWRAVRSFDKEEAAKLLQFVTGTSKVPLNGFKELEGMNGFAKFNIHRDYSSKEKLPSSHTCFNQLDLPEYESYEHLRQQLYTAITAGSEYFGFA